MKRKGKDINRSLSLPDVTSIDNIKQYPRYSSILTRQDGEGVGIEEIDALQMELETLLVNALQRARTFQVELMILENKADKTDLIKTKPKLQTNTSIITTIPPPPPPLIPTIPISDSNDKLTQLTSTTNAKRFKASAQRPSSTFTCNTDENALVIRNDISDIFWNMVQPYCSEITDDDVKFLKEQIELNNKVQTFTKDLPRLGKHYTVKWAEEDTAGEIKESNRLNIDKTEHLNGSLLSSHTDKKRKNFNNFLNEIDLFQTSTDTETSQYGPLTQRLISALIEQNLMTPFGTTNLNDFDMLNNDDQKAKHQKSQQLAEHPAAGNLFENKIREELIEQGILDKNDSDSDESSNKKQNLNSNHASEQEKDEIADEIKKLQNELLVIAEKCKDAQNELVTNAKQVMMQQSIRKKIDQCDVKIQEYFNKSLVMKQTKKYFPRKEKDKLNELIKERDALKLQMSQITVPNFG